MNIVDFVLRVSVIAFIAKHRVCTDPQIQRSIESIESSMQIAYHEKASGGFKHRRVYTVQNIAVDLGTQRTVIAGLQAY